MMSSSIKRIQLQLMIAHPFLASAVARLPVISVADSVHVQTMATDGYHIFVNPAFCEKLSESQIMGVLAHEVMHCLLGHIERRGDRNSNMWNQAIDHATNLLLLQMDFELPEEGLFDKKYTGQTAEEIYEKLNDQYKKQLKLLSQLSEDEDDSHDSKPEGTAEKSDQKTKIEKAYEVLNSDYEKSFDDHIEDDNVLGQLYEDEKPSPADLKRLRKELLKETQRELKEKGIGRFPAMLDQEIQMSISDEVPWQHLLARFFSGLRKNDFRTYPFNKKHVWRKIFLPSVGAPGPEHIVIAIDTSGSMSSDELSKILGELNQLKQTAECRMTLIQCDAEIQDIQEYDSWEIADIDLINYKFRGRGGTTFSPVFKWVQENVLDHGQRPDALFYLTDGYAYYDFDEPPYELMWILTQSGIESSEIPFGEIIRMN